jgi:hypothetical protein
VRMFFASSTPSSPSPSIQQVCLCAVFVVDYLISVCVASFSLCVLFMSVDSLSVCVRCHGLCIYCVCMIVLVYYLCVILGV